jgi:hypothetical protein
MCNILNILFLDKRKYLWCTYFSLTPGHKDIFIYVNSIGQELL